MSDQLTVLGLLMQNEADQAQPAEDQREASWVKISEAIDIIQYERRSDPAKIPHLDPIVPVADEEWNPKTAFNTRSMPRSGWRFPTRRLAFAMFAVFLGLAAFLAGSLYLQSSGILPGPTSTVHLTDDPIPLTDPNAAVPSLQRLIEFLSESDGRLLVSLSGQTPVVQKASIESLAARNKMEIRRTGTSAMPGTAYWISQKPSVQTGTVLVLIAREKSGEQGWQVIYQILPESAAIPSGQQLDEYFAKQMSKQTA